VLIFFVQVEYFSRRKAILREPTVAELRPLFHTDNPDFHGFEPSFLSFRSKRKRFVSASCVLITSFN
jgi:hypothetical protein